MNKPDIAQPPAVSLTGSEALQEMACREGYAPSDYVRRLADFLRDDRLSLAPQRERLAALAEIGSTADIATSLQLTEHLALLDALFCRFAAESVKALERTGPSAARAAEGYLGAALRAQRAALAVLSALKSIRDAPSTSTRGQAPAAGA